MDKIYKAFLPVFTFFIIFLGTAFPQEPEPIKMLPATGVKDQGNSGTCWCFSIMAIIESEMMKNGFDNPDLSELFIVRNVYLEKAKNYILRQGYTRFSEGAFAHDLIPTVTKYGLVPQYAYPNSSNDTINHIGFDVKLKKFLDSVLVKTPISPDWINNYTAMLDERFGKPPSEFEYEGRKYTPLEFANDVVKFKPEDYSGLTSFTHHPFYTYFNVEVPDNYSGGLFYNVPIDELLQIAEDAVMKGYTVGWDADVSNPFFNMKTGFAMYPEGVSDLKGKINPDASEISFTQESRQEMFENLTTQDDHLMQIIGLSKTPSGKKFFKVKNSWGKIGTYKGYIYVSETYFGINTITLILPTKALSEELQRKMKCR